MLKIPLCTRASAAWRVRVFALVVVEAGFSVAHVARVANAVEVAVVVRAQAVGAALCINYALVDFVADPRRHIHIKT